MTARDTDQLEHDMNELCHEWMHGKPPTDGVFGPVQATARVFIFQCLSAWTVLEASGQTEQLAPDFESWLRKVVEDPLRAQHRQREGLFPEALTSSSPHLTPPRPRARRRFFEHPASSAVKKSLDVLPGP